MLNLKDRITLLKNNTTSQKAIEIANAASSACKSNPLTDPIIAESMISDLSDIDDAEVKRFIARETILTNISKLGVKESYSNVIKGDLMHYPTIKPMLNGMAQIINSMPEYMIAEQFVAALSQYSWNKELKQDLDKVSESISKYNEDIQLSKFMYDIKNTSANYLSKVFEKELDTYFVERTETSRKRLLEKINPYTFDSTIKVLQKILLVSEGGLQIEANGEVVVEKIYSPVLIQEKSEIFFASGWFLKKTGNDIVIVNEEELKTLPANFVELAGFLSSANVSVSDNKITVVTESGNKTVDIISENNKTILKLNGKELPYNTFTKYFMNEGIFRPNDNKVLSQIAVLYENINNVYEIDYGKRLISKASKGYSSDIFKCEDKIYVIKINESQKVNEFLYDINATQTKQVILEHLRYDISESLRDLLPAEVEKLETLNKQKAELFEAIKLLGDKKSSVIEQVNSNPVLRTNPQVKELLEAIDVELNNLKEHAHAVNNMIKSLTVVGMFNANEFTNESGDPDGVDKLDKKNSSEEVKRAEDTVNPLESGDLIRLKNGDIGTVQGNDSNNAVIVAMENGKSVLIPQEFLNEVEILKKKSIEKNPEIQVAKNDGAQSVKVVENATEEWVEAQLVDAKGNKVEDVLVNALDYTSKGQNDTIEIKKGQTISKTLKKFVKASI